MKRIFSTRIALALLLGAAAPLPAQQGPADPDFQAVEALDARVATLGHRLAVANVELCAAREWRHGMVFIDLGQVAPAFQAAVSRAFGASAGLGVAALAAGGPGERAGLRPGDIIVALDGRALPSAGQRPERPIEESLAAVDSAFADGQADIEVRRRGEQSRASVRAEQGCVSRFEIVRERRRQGSADGRVVQVTLGLVDYAVDDAELAAVMAHELAHNVLGHRARLDEAGVARGFFGNFGRNARRIRETEVEADRLSVYLMERAGYDPAAAVRFWSRFGRRGLNFLGTPTHPNWRLRIQLLETEIANIRRARAAGTVPAPDFVRLPR